MQLPYSEKLDIAHFSRLFDNKSECYKLFWFQAIVSRIMQGKNVFTYEELINEMIADAWYMVTSGRDQRLEVQREERNASGISGKLQRQGCYGNEADFDTECPVSSSGAFYGIYARKRMEAQRRESG